MSLAAAADFKINIYKEPALLYKACLAIGLLLLCLMKLPGLITLTMVCLAAYAWRGSKEGIEALTVLFLVLNLNPGLFYFQGQGASLRWLVLFSAFGRVIWDGVLSNERWPFRLITVLVLYSSVVACLAMLFSRLPAVSFFKIVAFCIGTVTVTTCFYRTREIQAYWISWFFSLFILLLVASLPLYGSAIGFYTNGRGFQGILNHPQTFGPILAPITAGLTARLMLKETRSPLVVSGILGGVFAIVASQSRTALLMYTVSLIVMAGMLLFRKREYERHGHRPFLSPGIKFMVFISLCLLLVFKGAALGETVQSFVLKKSESAESMSFQIRASMVGRQMENFQNHPLTGIGFGVPSSVDDWVSLSTGFLGLPTGFPVEKGFLPSAMLEETGLIGGFLLVVVFCCLLAGPLRKGDLSIVVIMIACLLANTGEMVFFSFGAAGLYYWLLIGLCYNSVMPCVE